MSSAAGTQSPRETPGYAEGRSGPQVVAEPGPPQPFGQVGRVVEDHDRGGGVGRAADDGERGMARGWLAQRQGGARISFGGRSGVDERGDGLGVLGGGSSRPGTCGT
ncbi:hypothetical protein GCM10026982_10140 [Nocardiopsis aegyptia]